MLTGAGRLAQEAREKAERLERSQLIEGKRREMERKASLIEAQIAGLRSQLDAERDELAREIARENLHQEVLIRETQVMARARKSDQVPAPPKTVPKSVKRGGK